MVRILLVDDEENILNALRRVLSGQDAQGPGGGRPTVETFSSPQQALQRAQNTVFDLVISDYRMPEMNGVDFLKSFKAIQPDAARMVLSGYADLDGIIGAINEAQIFRFLAKPWHDSELKSAVAQALSHRALLLDNQRLADLVRLQQGKLTKQEMELRRLEQEAPGITKVNWGPNGEVMLDEAS
jgi:two-component system probable response regulator PhcQ